jgi:hypothetical protein
MANFGQGLRAVDLHQAKARDPIKSLWRNVLVVAIEDAIKACVLKCKHKADVTYHDILYITEPNQDFATICHYADLDHSLVRRKVGITFKKIEESYEQGNMSDVQGKWLHKGNRYERAKKISASNHKPVPNMQFTR